jgi:hypothetical protein
MPACHAGDRGFESRQLRLFAWAYSSMAELPAHKCAHVVPKSLVQESTHTKMIVCKAVGSPHSERIGDNSMPSKRLVR